MSYQDAYPELYKKYSVTNFEVVMEAIDKHLGDLFQLDVLEGFLVNADGSPESSATMFDHFMQVLGDLSPDKFEYITSLVQEQVELLKKYPAVFEAILSELSIPLARVQGLASLWLHVANYQDTHPLLAIDALLKTCNKRKHLLTLDDQRFDDMIKLMIDNFEVLLVYPVMFDHLLNFLGHMIQSGSPLDRVDAVTKWLTFGVDFQKANQAVSLDDLIKSVSACRADFFALNDERFAFMMQFMNDEFETIRQYPAVFEALLGLVSNEDIPMENIQILSEVLCAAAKYQANNAAIKIELLIEGVNRFQDKSIEVLNKLKALIVAHENYMPALLHNNVAEYMVDYVDDDAHTVVEGVIEKFYDDRAANLDDLFKGSNLKKWFDFEPADRKNRVILMHLLYQKVLVTGELPKTGLNLHDLAMVANEQILGDGFEQYTNHAARVLSDQRVSSARGLDVDQQEKLLGLTDELSFITQDELPESEMITSDKMAKDLTKLMANYKSARKDRLRRAQSEQLSANIDTILYPPEAIADDEDDDDKKNNQYMRVILSISKAKLLAIDTDFAQNPHRWRSFNTSGKSRYFNTLNQMQDMVVRHWSQDKNSLHSFKMYQEFNQQEFCNLTLRLNTAIRAHMDLHPAGAGNYGFFGGGKRREKALTTINDTIVGLAWSEGELPAMDFDSINDLDQILNDNIKKLPGHLQTLAKELITRTKSLIGHLALQQDEPIDILRPGGGE